MREFFNTKNVSILLGTALVIWSIIGLFTRPVLPPESPIDQPDDGSSILVIPTVEMPANGSIAPTQGALSDISSAGAAPAPTDDAAFLVPVATAASHAADGASVRAGSGAGQPASPHPLVPDRIVIPAIHLDAPIRLAGYRIIDISGMEFQQWEAPAEYAAGWQSSSAPLGVPGNTVLNGHHNVDGEVFGHLVDLSPGATIQVFSGSAVFTYRITNKMLLPERGQSLSVRLSNARWLEPTTDQRLTLITCWPPTTNTYRLIVVAKPVGATQP